MRTEERELLYKEMFASRHGDAVFPCRDYRTSDYFQVSFPLSLLMHKRRNEYYTEINHIFNNYSGDTKVGRNYKEFFLESLEKTKHLPINQYGDKEKSRWFEWLYDKKILRAIKQWEGDPLDLLYYLSQHGYIEMAVKRREKFIKSVTRYRFILRAGQGSFWPDMAHVRAVQKRTEKRKTSIENQQRKKEEKSATETSTKNSQNFTKQLLRIDNKIKIRETTRGPEKCIDLFSFMISEKHLPACLNWQAHSFNEHKQYIEFVRSCIFPYFIPKPLIFTSILPDQVIDSEEKWHHSPDHNAITMSRKWLLDIVSGDSFYARNKDLFTRTESHYFLVSKIEYHDPSSVFELYFNAKCKARSFDPALSVIITRLFSVKFAQYLQSPLITEFLDFIARNKNYPFSYNELMDMSDFILSKITHCDQNFSFSGRTIGSLSVLANEWHMNEQRRIAISKNSNTQIWQGLPIPYFLYETDDAFWEIKQICNIDDLFREGQRMHHCVASYAKSCVIGDCGIFNVSCSNNFNKGYGKLISHATVEISRGKTLVQARGKWNKPVEKKVMKIIKLWARDNKIKV
jgi:hypothetical protein